MRQFDVCFNDVYTFIGTMHSCYDKMTDLCWVNTNKIKYKQLEGGEQKAVPRTQIIVSRNSGLLFEDILVTLIICKTLRI